MRNFIAFFTTLAVATTAFAQEAAEAAPEEIMDIIPELIAAFKGGEWSVFASLVIMALVWVVTKAPFLSDKIKGKAKVWVAAVAGMLSAVAVTIIQGGEWHTAIVQGLMVGLGATGLFELIRRRASKEPIDADGDGVLDPRS